MPGCTTLGEALAHMTAAFRSAGLDTPGLDARRLVAWTLDIDPAALLGTPEMPIDAGGCSRLAAAAERRLAREPVSRIIGRRDFYGLELEISPATLDPRPDTEVLVDGVLGLVAAGRSPGGEAPRLLDLGTGSGAILIALLVRLRQATGVGVDMSEAALEVAQRNARRYGLGSRAGFRRSNWLAEVTGTFDIVAANPPYIPRSEIATLEPEVRLYEPAAALDGGGDGLDAYRAIVAGALGVLTPGGWLVLEVGAGQAAAVQGLVETAAGAEPLEIVEVWPDLSCNSRCVAARALCSAKGRRAARRCSP
jgi:release factor glutamine methyltransferase